MKFLKAFLIIFFLQLGINTASAQVYKFKATSNSVMKKDKNNKWSEWSEPENSVVMITLDTEKNRIIVGSQEIQLYSILEYGKKVSDKNQETVPFSCVDNDGTLCTILIVTRKNQGNRKQIYINFDDFKIVYNVY